MSACSLCNTFLLSPRMVEGAKNTKWWLLFPCTTWGVERQECPANVLTLYTKMLIPLLNAQHSYLNHHSIIAPLDPATLVLGSMVWVLVVAAGPHIHHDSSQKCLLACSRIAECLEHCTVKADLDFGNKRHRMSKGQMGEIWPPCFPSDLTLLLAQQSSFHSTCSQTKVVHHL